MRQWCRQPINPLAGEPALQGRMMPGRVVGHGFTFAARRGPESPLRTNRTMLQPLHGKLNPSVFQSADNPANQVPRGAGAYVILSLPSRGV
jgi:hypothetical protein